jgi:hypothetical protein
MIINYPDFIIEGMAVYGQNLYRYGKSKKIKEVLREDFQSLGCAVSYFDMDSTFQKYSGCQLDKAYFLGGYIIASQSNPLKLFQMSTLDKASSNETYFSIAASLKINMKPAMSLLKSDFEYFTNKFMGYKSSYKTVYVNNNFLKFRAAPNTSTGKVIRILKAYELLRVIGESNGWYNVVDKDLKEGWVSGKYTNAVD